MSGQEEAGVEAGQLVGRCYTRARKLPLVLGQWEGLRLWGGPYTVPQLVTMVVTVGLMVLTYPLWGHFGLLNVVPLVGVPYGASFAVRSLRVDGRSPFAALAGMANLAAAPRGGRLGGRPVRQPRAQLLRGACTLSWWPVAGTPRGRGPVRAAALEAGRQTGRSPGAACAAGPAGEPAVLRAGAVGDGVALSGAGALLASRRAGERSGVRG